MDRAVAKDILYGGVRELMDNKNFYYKSSINPSYNKWTESGLQAVTDFVHIMTPQIYQAEQDELDRKSKALVMNSLKVTDAV